MSSPGRPPKKSTKGKRKATRINSSSDESEEDDDDDDSAEEEEADPFRAAMLDKLKDFENSAKMTGMINLLTLWKEETPGDKVVVYSQWTSCMDCELLCCKFVLCPQGTHTDVYSARSCT